MGGDAESIAIGDKLWMSNQNFINIKLQHTKVNQSGELDPRDGLSDNRAFPESDKLTVLDISWEHKLNPKTTISSHT